MIDFRDFFPLEQSKRLGGMVKDFEHLREMMVRVNAWIAAENVDVVSVETIIMPRNTQSEHDQAKAKIDAYGNGSSLYHYQMLRVWFRARPATGTVNTGITERLG